MSLSQPWAQRAHVGSLKSAGLGPGAGGGEHGSMHTMQLQKLQVRPALPLPQPVTKPLPMQPGGGGPLATCALAGPPDDSAHVGV